MTTAAEYMRVARVASTKNLDLQMFDGGVRAFLDAFLYPLVNRR